MMNVPFGESFDEAARRERREHGAKALAADAKATQDIRKRLIAAIVAEFKVQPDVLEQSAITELSSITRALRIILATQPAAAA